MDDRITILGIPVEQITPVTQAALAGLVAEINHLRSQVKRHERSAEKRSSGQAQQTEAAILELEAFLRMLGATLGQPPGEGNSWIIVLVHVATYEDIRRSSGLLAANSALAEVAHRLKDARISTATIQPMISVDSPASPSSVTTSVAAMEPASVPFVLLGYAGGSNIAGVTAVPIDSLDTAVVAKSVRAHLSASGYGVGGIDMALDMTVAAAAVGSGESALLALGRVDHQLRTN